MGQITDAGADDFSLGGWLRAVVSEGAYEKHLAEFLEFLPVAGEDLDEELDFHATLGSASRNDDDIVATRARMLAEPAVVALRAELEERDRREEELFARLGIRPAAMDDGDAP